MSATASETVVLVVGALTPKVLSSLSGMGAGRRILVEEGGRDVRIGQVEGVVWEESARMGIVLGM